MKSASIAMLAGGLNLYVMHFRLGVDFVLTTIVGMIIAAGFGWLHRKADEARRQPPSP